MGLGGLYSAAANLDSKSLALPIPPPDFKTCGLSEVIARDQSSMLRVPCCPPTSQTVTPYVLPEVTSMRLRKPAHTLDPDSIDQYMNAVQMMRDLDTTDPDNPHGFTQQAKIHCAYCDGAYPATGFNDVKISVHFSWLFFPFHRWYLYFYERILGKLIGNPDFALPFWNWDNRDGMQIPPIFNDLTSYPNNPLYDLKRDPMSAPPNIVDLQSGSHSGATTAQIINNNLSQMHNEMISVVSSTTDFMGKSYVAGESPPPTTNGGKSELGSHISVHKWVGVSSTTFHEDLGNFYSAGNDPLFYCHHANVDRMWTLWKILETSVPKNITDQDYLNSSFLFYDENKDLRSVTVADCIDCTKMGYEYQYSDIKPWAKYSPSPSPSKKTTLVKKRSKRAAPEVTFPLTLDKTRSILVQKPGKGKADEVLVLENVEIDPTKIIKFNIFVNDEDDDPSNLDRAEYAGTFAQLIPHAHSMKTKPSSINYSLKELYQNIGIGDDDQAVVVTLYPIYNGNDVKIGGIKIIKGA
ncbi:hypothetical protein C2S52_000621 [Perilla frutescens var. hirtella]|nr:hypothetical protein C2S52_000621 [Perilla frutescens var. hirtella]